MSDWKKRAVVVSDEAAPKGSWRDRAQVVDPETSMLESGARGLAQGASLGFADEITGGVESAIDMLTGKTDALNFASDYSKHRDESREAYKNAQEANPKSYIAGELGGALATTALVPGMSGGATLATRTAQAALGGGISGLGTSEADLMKGETDKALADAALGAGMSAGINALGEKVIVPGLKAAGSKISEGAQKVGNYLDDKVGGKFSDAVDWTLKKAGKIGASVDEEATAKYLANPDRINDAIPTEELYDSLQHGAVPAFQEHLSKLDKAAWDALDTTPNIPKADILQAGQDFVDGILRGKNGSLTRSAATGADADKVRAISSQLAEIANAYGDNLSQSDLKSIVQSLQKLGYSLEGSPRTSIQGQAMQQLSGSYNEVLKRLNPVYADKMVPVQEATSHLQAIKRSFINQQSPDDPTKFMRTAKRMLKMPKDSEARVATRALDDATGAGFGDAIDDYAVKQAFEKTDTAGSRKTLAGTIAGKAVGSAIGGIAGYELGGDYGAGGGAMAGFAADKYAGQVFKAILNGRIAMDKAAPILTQKLGKFAKPLLDAASRGQSAVAATHFILSQQNPEYREKVNALDQSDDEE